MKIAIIGGGIAGCTSALELAEAGHQVTIFEKSAQLLAGTSDATPCRLGLGFHYFDLATATKYLEATLHFIKKHPGFIFAEDKPQNHPYRRWRYFVTQDSLFPAEEVKALFETLKNEYIRLVAENGNYAIFGPVDSFYRELTSEELAQAVEQGLVQKEKVIAGFETAEQVLDWPKFKIYLLNKINSHPNITVQTNTNVTNVKKQPYGFTIKLTKQVEGKLRREIAQMDFVVNASWYNIELLNQKSGLAISLQPRINRIKVITEIELPENFEADGAVNSMFFCFGPHCSFTNLGGRRAFISYEPATNIGSSAALKIPAKYERLLAGKATPKEIQYYGNKILAGVIQYIPRIAGAKVISTKFGVVRITAEGNEQHINVDITNPNSNIHKRRSSGIKLEATGWVTAAAMKLLYGPQNATLVKALIDQSTTININKTKLTSLYANSINVNPLLPIYTYTGPSICATVWQ